jgi:hypothetical protein
MKIQLLLKSLASAIMILFLSGCVPSTPTAITPDLVTPPPATWTPGPSITPTACTGWNCTLEGVIYADEASPGNELAGVNVHLKQTSWCSPTKGEYETMTEEDGTFRFEVYLHDTDSFLIELAVGGYQPASELIGGFDCLYCACPPIEIILQPVE